jgi:hypothetical protein
MKRDFVLETFLTNKGASQAALLKIGAAPHYSVYHFFPSFGLKVIQFKQAKTIIAGPTLEPQ